MTNGSGDDTLLIGLTGSIGAGKSTVADLFEEAGIPVLRSDLIARELMQSNPELIAEITEAFGTEIYADGVLDRSRLAAVIFGDRAQLDRINEMVHPRTIAETGVRAAKLFAEGQRVVAVEAALIYETDGENRFDYMVVVDADPKIRLERAAARDGADIERVRQRDAMQMSAEEKVRRADFVIRNDGSLDDLKSNTAFVIDMLRMLPPRERLDVEEED